MKTNTRILYGLLLLVISVFSSSCTNQNLFEPTSKEARKKARTAEIKKAPLHCLKTDDKINVSIWNHDDMSIGSLFGIYNSNEVYNKWVLVNEDGYVSFPKIGKIHLGGLTLDEATEKVTMAYSEYVNSPIVVLKLLNKEFTILGQILGAGTYVIEKESYTLFEGLSKAGIVDFYANMKDVKFIRGGEEYILDLTDMGEYERNNIVLQDGDIIFIPTRKGITLDKKAPLVIPLSSLVTTIFILTQLFK